ncbi:PIN domain-containing protein [Caulobacter sp. KR2-114]|uniref:PIN domain-containing protein n=1 Tax=Caulobacter sp. KR2-114 TaxID=3400912 RepID=UPI003BFFEDF7
MVAFLSGDVGDDVVRIDRAISDGELWLPPPVVSELLSKPDASQIEPLLAGVPLLDISPGFWERAGRSRRAVRIEGLKAALADSLIAQCCIDADVPLITRDRDYRHFQRWCGLKLAL